jgi:hypothetical protein
MLDFLVTESARRSCPICPRCGLMMMIARITPHPEREPGALLCSYECDCGETISRKEP